MGEVGLAVQRVMEAKALETELILSGSLPTTSGAEENQRRDDGT
eukprot:NODE_9599_length_313_cov_24.196970_g7831_i0.p4 GENE.NODE_9599_length_313_cov_24.196970_g7831_i0~~NODE_9599_length_313_cov_24.196970_g7831_i0.p4  ORF type:complete len:51 (-),score=11.32 NODE_9599_length_313_cov_24.196970_g7831_i0:159-290(-)